MNIVPNRSLSSLHILLDCIFLVILALYLIRTKRYAAFWAGVLGGLLYFVVDYGGFYLLLGTRKVVGASPFLFLLWLSLSYGFTNMAWVWLWFDEKENRREWSYLIIIAWFTIAIISQRAGASWNHISIQRGTGGYHWIMAVFLIVGYSYLIFKNLSAKTEAEKVDIKSILFIGILVQLGWEAVLFLTGIRQAGIMTLIIDSLLETNMGAPYLYLIHQAVSAKLKKES
ncbi:hypothetical protein DWQ65_10530 [Treponema phagedenis]|uniref:Uncharacterized protein n=1 Tax=Treponema phagedenis TaxID=162 RepID=A0A0B7GZE9_TREPH|nr:hypothetical protein [Treponema phagedenis]EFW36858.1 hypothetical protein HMPREF9554_02651 [Treponema phagedenis F0421]NVP24007.1 hypothetical protein [Treponema phagedenis]QEJ93870.1 hypothetical protein FUT79_00650 [Treponema phagedenis]QEJ99424.1 hypothetical protein FUT82_16470 [Treponema phagedenis]QEJ99795.1 hypothetical protein FUT84_00445 [Treponema phagedenis]